MKISNKTRNAMRREYRQGKPIDEICQKHGVPRHLFPALVRRYLTGRDIQSRRAIVHDYKGKKAELLRLQQIHKTDAGIGDALGITRERVRQIRNLLGIPPLKKSAATK